MAVINPYTRKGTEQNTEPAPIPANLSTLPGTRFLAKRKRGGNAEAVSLPAKLAKLKPGTVWGNGRETVTVDYLTVPGTRDGKPAMVSGDAVQPGEPCFVSFTDEHGNPTGYTPVMSFLSRFPSPVAVARDERKRAVSAPDSATEPARVNAVTLGSFV